MANISTENINTLAQIASSIGDGDYIYIFKGGAQAFSRIEKSLFMQEMSGGGGGSEETPSISIVDDGETLFVTISNDTPVITVSTSSLVIGGGGTTATFTVSGANLKSSIQLTASDGFSVTPSTIDKGAGATVVTVTYNGSSDNANGTIIASSNGAQSKSVSVAYTTAQVPTLSVSESSLSFSAGAGDTVQRTFTVSGVNLEGDISVSVSGAKFSVSPTTIQRNGTTASATVTVTYNPSASDSGTHTGTITISSANATSKNVGLSGSVIAKTLTITPSTLNIESNTGQTASGTFAIKGENLTNAVSIVSSSSDFELSVSSISASDINSAGSAGVQVTVTRKATASAASATITATSGSLTATASVAWTEQVVEETPSVGDTIVKSGIYYQVLSLPNGSESGTLMLINPAGDNSDTASTYSGNFDVPSSITYANGQYTVIKIGQRAFRNGSVSSVHIPSTINEIRQSAFYGCSSLTSVTFDEGSLNNDTSAGLGQQAFASTKITGTLTLPSTLKLTGTNVFNSSNIKLTTLVIGKAGTNEGVALNLRTSFHPNCDIDNIIIHKTVPPTTGNGTYLSDYIRDNAKVYVPKDNLEDYKASRDWASFHTNGRLFTIESMEG